VIPEERVEQAADELAATEEAITNIREQLVEAPSDLAHIAESRARAIQRGMKEELQDESRVWELIHELHAFEYDLEAAIETNTAGASVESLADALRTVRGTLKDVRAWNVNLADRVAEDDPNASDASHQLWEDAREARQALKEGALPIDQAQELKTILIERAARVEDDQKLLAGSSGESGLHATAEKKDQTEKTLTEVRAAIADLGHEEERQAVDVTDDARIELSSVQETDPHRKELEQIIRQQQSLEPKIFKRYDKTPQQLFEQGGPAGFLHGLRRLVSADEDKILDPYEKWKKLEEKRMLLEHLRNPEPAKAKRPPAPSRRKKKAA
jgi:hypothetical protein